jgi:hypothetical protein
MEAFPSAHFASLLRDQYGNSQLVFIPSIANLPPGFSKSNTMLTAVSYSAIISSANVQSIPSKLIFDVYEAMLALISCTFVQLRAATSLWAIFSDSEEMSIPTIAPLLCR